MSQHQLDMGFGLETCGIDFDTATADEIPEPEFMVDDPTPETIVTVCSSIQRGWTPQERHEREAYQLTVREVRIGRHWD